LPRLDSYNTKMNLKYIRVASDLHLEQHYGQKADFLAQTFVLDDERDAESILVLAGDISSKLDQLIPFLNRMKARFPKVYYIPGNHEFYGHTMEKWCEEFQFGMQPHPEGDNFEFALLDMCYEELEGVRFIFGTMWADGGTSLADQAMVGRYLRDFYVIKTKQNNQKEPRRYTVPDMVRIHKRQRKQLEGFLAQPFDGKTVVITHHMPSYRLCHPRFGGEANGGFAGNLDLILATDNAPELWIHGHTHDTIDTTLWKTRIVCNPSGYYFETDRRYHQYGPKFIEIATLSKEPAVEEKKTPLEEHLEMYRKIDG